MEAMLLAALTMVAYGLLGLFVLLPGVLVWRADSGQSGRRVGRILLGWWGGRVWFAGVVVAGGDRGTMLRLDGAREMRVGVV
jgi:hypothetical protein